MVKRNHAKYRAAEPDLATAVLANVSQVRLAREGGRPLWTADGGALLVQTLVLRRVLERAILASDEKNVAILLPPSLGAVLVNAALPLSGRVPVNLNYTASSDTVKSCLAQVAHGTS